ncbi:30S ribosomal protein S21 [Alphaproteobacteria bacterium endosymbiont of Tiliacea citrago]|uniref:30S ribosomal protein S21 n=1 Tax=Alphaproteobacteria bacterium endosymbiont of Tiliacea citrago TaxID=3077944 RepID=UPI00313B7FD7
MLLKVAVKDGQVDHANRILKKRMQRSGLFDYLQTHKNHVPKTQTRTEKKAEKLKVIAKYLKNRMKREGY